MEKEESLMNLRSSSITILTSLRESSLIFVRLQRFVLRRIKSRVLNPRKLSQYLKRLKFRITGALQIETIKVIPNLLSLRENLQQVLSTVYVIPDIRQFTLPQVL